MCARIDIAPSMVNAHSSRALRAVRPIISRFINAVEDVAAATVGQRTRSLSIFACRSGIKRLRAVTTTVSLAASDADGDRAVGRAECARQSTFLDNAARPVRFVRVDEYF